MPERPQHRGRPPPPFVQSPLTSPAASDRAASPWTGFGQRRPWRGPSTGLPAPIRVARLPRPPTGSFPSSYSARGVVAEF